MSYSKFSEIFFEYYLTSIKTLQKIKKEFKDKVAEINEIELMFNAKQSTITKIQAAQEKDEIKDALISELKQESLIERDYFENSEPKPIYFPK